MFAVQLEADTGTFASLVEIYKLGIQEALLKLQKLGVRSFWQLQDWPRPQLREALGDVTLDVRLNPRPNRAGMTCLWCIPIQGALCSESDWTQVRPQ